MPSGATATPDLARPGRADLHHRARAPGDYRRRRGLLRRGLARDAGLERLADAALQLRRSLAEAGPLLLDDGRRLCRRRGHGRGRTLRGGDGGPGPGADHLVGRAAPSQFGGRRLAGGGDRGHFLRLFRHGALGAARLAAGPVHHGHDRHRAARRRPWSRRDALVDPGRHGRRLRLPDEGTGRGRRSRGGAAAGLVAGACNRAPIVAGHPRGHGHERAGRVAVVRRDVRRARAPVSGQLLPDRQPRTVHHLPLQRTAAAVVLSGGDRRRPAALDAVCDRSGRRGAASTA